MAMKPARREWVQNGRMTEHRVDYCDECDYEMSEKVTSRFARRMLVHYCSRCGFEDLDGSSEVWGGRQTAHVSSRYMRQAYEASL